MIPVINSFLKTVLHMHHKFFDFRMTPFKVFCEQKIVKSYRTCCARHNPRCFDVFFETSIIGYNNRFISHCSFNGSHSDALGV